MGVGGLRGYRDLATGTIFNAAVCWGGSVTERDARKLDKLIQKASSVLGRCLDSLKAVVRM